MQPAWRGQRQEPTLSRRHPDCLSSETRMMCMKTQVAASSMTLETSLDTRGWRGRSGRNQMIMSSRAPRGLDSRNPIQPRVVHQVATVSQYIWPLTRSFPSHLKRIGRNGAQNGRFNVPAGSSSRESARQRSRPSRSTADRDRASFWEARGRAEPRLGIRMVSFQAARTSTKYTNSFVAADYCSDGLSDRVQCPQVFAWTCRVSSP